MSLLQVHQTAAQALSANPKAFGVPVAFVDPEGSTANVVCQQSDIQAVIDTETQMPVTSRQISIVVSDEARAEAGMGVPVAVHSSDDGRAPWLVEYDEKTWKVFDVRRDRTMGLTTCFLEVFDAR